MKKQKKLSVMAQLMMLCVIPLVVMVACVTVYAISTMRNMVRDATMEGLENLCKSVYALMRRSIRAHTGWKGNAL